MDAICNQVYSQFPDLKGVKPVTQKMGSLGQGNVLFIFKGTSKTSSGKNIPRVVRVVATDTGKIIKMTTSH
jgi:hypothetical protein